ncbi:MAG: MmcQ/YjbR family DNA-binding protein [Weeksellaceae bacterium]|nr:MmcQ/YjbR family DNA-binding protein [Weeksellaceae bacterium]
MHIEQLREICLAFPHVTEDFPFDQKTLVCRVGNKIFALTDIEEVEPSVNLKCDPELATAWREQYSAVKPGYHMNKKHWNTVHIHALPEHIVHQMLQHSYDCVWKNLPLKVRKQLTSPEP